MSISKLRAWRRDRIVRLIFSTQRKRVMRGRCFHRRLYTSPLSSIGCSNHPIRSNFHTSRALSNAQDDSVNFSPVKASREAGQPPQPSSAANVSRKDTDTVNDGSEFPRCSSNNEKRPERDFSSLLSDIAEGLTDRGSIPTPATDAGVGGNDNGEPKPSETDTERVHESQSITDILSSDSSKLSSTLPQSPLISPTLKSARSRYNTADQPPKHHDPTSTRLLDNPWARMLASPIRLCAVTGLRLPSSLLSEWKLIRPPDSTYQVEKENSNSKSDVQTSPPWLLPADLTGELNTKRTYDGMTTLRILPTKSVMQYTTDVSNSDKAPAHQKRIVHRQWLEAGLRPVSNPNVRGKGSKQFFVCRDDMPDFYLRLLRKRVVEALGDMAQIRRGGKGAKPGKVVVRTIGGVSPLFQPEKKVGMMGEKPATTYLRGLDELEAKAAKDAQRRLKRGVAVLWIGESGRPVIKESNLDSKLYATADLPVLDLPGLLGEEFMGVLRERVPEAFGFAGAAGTKLAGEDVEGGEAEKEVGADESGTGTGFTKGEWVIVKLGPPRAQNLSSKNELVMEAMGLLWRLQGYLALPEVRGEKEGKPGQQWEERGREREDKEEGLMADQWIDAEEERRMEEQKWRVSTERDVRKRRGEGSTWTAIKERLDQKE